MSALTWRAACGSVLLVCVCGCSLGLFPKAQRVWVRPDRVLAQQFNDEGLALIEQDRLAEAEARFRQALEADPYHGPAHCNLGVCLLQLGKFYEAGWQLRYACQLMPKAAQPRTNLGILYESVGRHGLAEEKLRQALQLAPEDVEIIGHLARVHVRQDLCTSETVAWLQTVATQDDHPAWRNWAREELIPRSDSGLEHGR